jgi:hypothetical protein
MALEETGKNRQSYVALAACGCVKAAQREDGDPVMLSTKFTDWHADDYRIELMDSKEATAKLVQPCTHPPPCP